MACYDSRRCLKTGKHLRGLYHGSPIKALIGLRRVFDCIGGAASSNWNSVQAFLRHCMGCSYPHVLYAFSLTV